MPSSKPSSSGWQYSPMPHPALPDSGFSVQAVAVQESVRGTTPSGEGGGGAQGSRNAGCMQNKTYRMHAKIFNTAHQQCTQLLKHACTGAVMPSNTLYNDAADRPSIVTAAQGDLVHCQIQPQESDQTATPAFSPAAPNTCPDSSC